MQIKINQFSHMFLVVPSPGPASGLLTNTGLGVPVGIGNANRSFDSKMRVELVCFSHRSFGVFFGRVDAIKLLRQFNYVFI